METIFALSTAPGKAAVAIIRISGPEAFGVVQALCGNVPPLRHAALRRIRLQGAVIDEGLVICFGAGASFTGEDLAELQVHGSRAVVARLLDALSRMDGLRPAEPGEFTRRALERGKLDLAQVEGLADLIDAETEAQRLQAMREISGSMSHHVDGWRAQLVAVEAMLTATIDFADEDVPEEISAQVAPAIGVLLSEWRREVSGSVIAERVRDGFEVAIVGRPNAGKSTLLNAIARRDVAITSSIAGTTRDVIEVRLDMRGIPVTLLDTAGLRATVDAVEAEGVRRTIGRATAADLRIFVLDDSGLPDGLLPCGDDIVVDGKADLRGMPDGISGLTGLGIDALLDRVAEIVTSRVAAVGAATRMRHRRALESAIAGLVRAQDAAASGTLEIAAEGVGEARRAMEVLIGRIGVEDVLGDLFARFCIGK